MLCMALVTLCSKGMSAPPKAARRIWLMILAAMSWLVWLRTALCSLASEYPALSSNNLISLSCSRLRSRGLLTTIYLQFGTIDFS
jgi:hypothetical protein